MAEAVVEERNTQPTRFFCHMCNVEINIPNTDYTCPLCSGGFVEELPDNAPANVTTSSTNVEPTSFARNSVGDPPSLARLSDIEAIRSDIASLLTSRNGPNLEIRIEPGTRRANVTLGGGNINSNGAGTGGGRVRPSNLDRLDNVLLDFLQSLPLGNGGDFGNSQMFFMGNPGDYAWGREGLDTIVTQMLNQMETSGPPPLAQQKIDEIEKVAVTADEVERKIQCSVCWEDFQLNEIVRKLPCLHIYHENCIVPWLVLHGTCPICRKSLIDEADDSIVMDEPIDGHRMTCPMHTNTSAAQTGARSGNVQSGARSGVAQTSARGGVAHRGARNGAATTTSATNNVQQQRNDPATSQNRTTTVSSQQQQQQRRNNVFTFDEDNFNLD